MAFDLGGSKRLFLHCRISQINQENDRSGFSLLRPGQIFFILALSHACDTLGANQRGNEGLCFLILKGSAEGIECDGIGCRINDLIFLIWATIKEDRIFHFSSEVRDVFGHDCILEPRRLLIDFHLELCLRSYRLLINLNNESKWIRSFHWGSLAIIVKNAMAPSTMYLNIG